MLRIVKDDYEHSILSDDKRNWILDIWGWDDGTVFYKLFKSDDEYNPIIKETSLEEDPELQRIVFMTIYDYLLKKNGL